MDNNGLAFLAFQSYVDGKANIGLWNFIKNNGFKRSHMQDPKWRINFEPAGYDISFKEFLEGPSLVDGDEDWKIVADQLKDIVYGIHSSIPEPKPDYNSQDFAQNGGQTYKVHNGPRGGRYIVTKGKKIYIK